MSVVNWFKSLFKGKEKQDHIYEVGKAVVTYLTYVDGEYLRVKLTINGYAFYGGKYMSHDWVHERTAEELVKKTMGKKWIPSDGGTFYNCDTVVSYEVEYSEHKVVVNY